MIFVHAREGSWILPLLLLPSAACTPIVVEVLEVPEVRVAAARPAPVFVGNVEIRSLTSSEMEEAQSRFGSSLEDGDYIYMIYMGQCGPPDTIKDVGCGEMTGQGGDILFQENGPKSFCDRPLGPFEFIVPRVPCTEIPFEKIPPKRKFHFETFLVVPCSAVCSLVEVEGGGHCSGACRVREGARSVKEPR